MNEILFQFMGKRSSFMVFDMRIKDGENMKRHLRMR